MLINNDIFRSKIVSSYYQNNRNSYICDICGFIASLLTVPNDLELYLYHLPPLLTSVLGTWIDRYRRHEGTAVFWYRTGSVHGLIGIAEPKVRACFGIASGGTWIASDTKTSTATCLPGGTYQKAAS